MTSTTTTTAGPSTEAFARAFGGALPFKGRLRAAGPAAPRTGEVVLSTSFVGERTAEIALVLTDASVLEGASGGATVAPGDLLRPAVDAAVAELGSGVLTEFAPVADPTIFEDATAVWEIASGNTVLGAIALRVREGAPAARPVDLSARMGRLNSVEMELTVEIGRTRLTVRELLALEVGAIVELDRSVGSPADVLLNGRLIAHGEVVVVDQDYAVRITRILDAPEESR